MTWLWIVIGIALPLVGMFLYWAFVITEGAYLGARIVAWTYDLTARRYEQIKQFNPIHDAWLLAKPMLEALGTVDCPLILDVATGTGRMPYALLKRPLFDGTVIGLDLSRKMLQEANGKLGNHRGRYVLVWRDAQDLPFPDNTFDGVSCLEALEFMPSPQRLLDEMGRVLRPGGVFVITNRINWESRLMPGKAFSEDELRAMLSAAGLDRVEFRPWQVYYDLIWARKAGGSARLGRGTRQIEQILRCPRCHATSFLGSEAELRCQSCGASYTVADEIVHMA